MNHSANLDYALHLLRDHAYADYLALAQLPPDMRARLLPIAALDVELRLIASKVDEEMIAHIRFAWWREGVEALCNGQPPRGHPLLELLGPVIYENALTLAPFAAMIDEVQNAYPTKLTHSTEALHELVVSQLDEVTAARWLRARMQIHLHMKKYGNGRRLWLLLTLLFSAK